MRFIIAFLLISIVFLAGSCREDFSTSLNTEKLGFSKDTVFLDTVFSTIGSSTYKLKVYNKSADPIFIPSIHLGRGNASSYRLNVDGAPGKSFENVEILPRDSLYIFIETTLDYATVPDPLYIDSIIFDSGNFIQDVKLVTLVNDAVFLFPSKNNEGLIETISLGTNADGEDIRIRGFYLNNTTFTNEKPYVIYGYCAVPEGETLDIEEGSSLYFHANSGLIVSKNASLNIQGTLNSPVQIEGDRLEPAFSDIPGQWGAIWLRAGSKNNNIDHTIIKNASVGIIMDSIGLPDTPALTIKNTQIYNSSSFGLLGRETHIEGENLVINNSGQSSLACIIGGRYSFTHSTFTNYWRNGLRDFPSVLINNFFTYTSEGNLIAETRDLHEASFTNCIIDGNNNIELLVDKIEGSVFNYNFNTNLIKFNDYSDSYKDVPEYDFSNTSHYSNILLNGKVDFKNPGKNDLIIGQDSEAVGRALETGTLKVPLDILGTSRTIPSDIGAYVHQIFDPENN